MQLKTRKIFFTFLFGLLMINFLGVFVSAFSVNLDTPPSNQIIIDVSSFLNLGNTWKDIIFGIIIIAIVFAGLFDILELVSIFQNPWVKIVIAAGLSLIAALTGLVNAITLFLLQIAAGAGAIGIAVEIVVSIVVFIGLSLGSSAMAKFAAKRKAQAAIVKSIEGSGNVEAAIEGLGKVQKGFEKAAKKKF